MLVDVDDVTVHCEHINRKLLVKQVLRSHTDTVMQHRPAEQHDPQASIAPALTQDEEPALYRKAYLMTAVRSCATAFWTACVDCSKSSVCRGKDVKGEASGIEGAETTVQADARRQALLHNSALYEDNFIFA